MNMKCRWHHPGLMLRFPSAPAFFAGLLFLEDVRLPFACGTPGSAVVAFSGSIAFLLIVFLLDRVAVVTFITPAGRNSK